MFLARRGTKGCGVRSGRRTRPPPGDDVIPGARHGAACRAVPAPVRRAVRAGAAVRLGRRCHRAAARPGAAGPARRRASLPVRPAGRRGDRAAAAGRHPVPDAVLPDLPARGRRGGPSRVGRADAGDDAADRGRARAAAGLPGGAPRLPGPARPGGPPVGRRAAPAGHAQRRRHAGPGEVPARAGRARARGPGNEPARGRGGAGRGAVVAGGPVRRPARGAAAGYGAMNGSGTVRVAAVDCGTNSLRLLIADVDRRAGRLADVDRRMEIVRLGQGVDATGRLAPEPLARTLRALEAYARAIDDASAGCVRMVATSAMRDAANGGEFIRGVTRILGVPPEVLSGDEEARLSFTGATAEFAAAGPGDPLPPYLVVDIGGGSTEFVLGDGGPDAAGPVAAVSVDIGCVRMTERHLHTNPPRPGEVSAATADIDAALDEVAAKVPVTSARTLIGLAGSVTTVAGIALGLPAYDPARIHLVRV